MGNAEVPEDLPETWRVGDAARLLDEARRLVDIAERAALAGREHTASRRRVLWYGNTAHAADDPQLTAVLERHDGEAAVARWAFEHHLDAIRAGEAGPGDTRTLIAGVEPIARRLVTGLFDTLGASSTLAEHGLHRLWLEFHDLARPAR